MIPEKEKMTKNDGNNNLNGNQKIMDNTTKKMINTSISTQMQNLQRELLFNQKIGKNVLEKPELTRVLERRMDEQKKKDIMKEKIIRKNSFEKKLEAQALKLQERQDQQNNHDDNGENPFNRKLLLSPTPRTTKMTPQTTTTPTPPLRTTVTTILMNKNKINNNNSNLSLNTNSKQEKGMCEFLKMHAKIAERNEQNESKKIIT